jgi:hypothetical protein
MSPQDRWLLDAALCTLLDWAKFPKPYAVETASAIPMISAKLPTADYQETTLHWAYEGDGLVSCPFPPADENVEFELKQQWRGPIFQPWEQFEKGAIEGLRTELKRHRAAVSKLFGWLGMPKRLKQNARHYKWLALFQLNGLSPREISVLEFGERQYEHRVQQGISKTAVQIGLTLRNPRKRGRPKRPAR